PAPTAAHPRSLLDALPILRSVLGLQRPVDGRIEVLGADARSDDPRQRQLIQRNTGVLFQDGALFSSLTVGENVEVPLREHHPELDRKSTRLNSSHVKISYA